ncbi:MAG: hypothetical protein ACLKAK_02970 [Alkaliphilus sp.]
MGYIDNIVNGYKIQVSYEDRIIRIKNDSTLKTMLQKTSRGSQRLASTTKNLYRHFMLKELNISNDSLAIEILGHVYPGHIIDAIRSLPLPTNVKLALESLSIRTSIIDCGEKYDKNRNELDGNRWVWDSLDVFLDVLVESLPTP